MALIHRGERCYLIRSVRVGSRVTSRYVASGKRAVEIHRALRSMAGIPSLPRDPDRLAAYYERQVERARRDYERERRRKFRRRFLRVRRRLDATDACVAALAIEAKATAAAVMRAAGFHQVRWCWRKMRGGEMQPNAIHEAACRAVGLTGSEPEPTEAELAEFRASHSAEGCSRTIDRAVAYDRGLEASGSTEPRSVPSLVRIFGGDPVADVLDLLLDKAARHHNAIGRELVRREYLRVRADLTGPDPTGIEKHLAERAAICWLDAYVADRIALTLNESLNFSPSEKSYFQKTRDRAHKRFVDTCRVLALIRSRALPAMRLGVAVRHHDGSGAGVTLEVAGSDGGGE